MHKNQALKLNVEANRDYSDTRFEKNLMPYSSKLNQLE